MIALFVAAPVVVVVISSMMQSSSSLTYSYTAQQRGRRQRHRIGGQWGGQKNAAFARTHTDDRVGTAQLEQHRPRWMTVSNHKRSLLTAMEGTNDNDDEYDTSFDPFLQSPLSFGEATTTMTASKAEEEEEAGAANNGRNFGFLTYAENHVGSTAATTTSSMQFDPLLSPHVYTNGIDAGPSMQQPQQQTQRQKQQQKRLGIILIDHGSKRQASNDHIHKIAQMYEQSLQQLNSPSSSSSKSNNNIIRQLYSGGGGGSVIVKAAHMEIASPSILDTIRDIIIGDRVTSIICVPYFLSPGRHATEDVPELIHQARDILRQEGLLTLASTATGNDDDGDGDNNKDDEISIVMSDALGTHLVGMLSVVDDLVLQTFNNM